MIRLLKNIVRYDKKRMNENSTHSKTEKNIGMTQYISSIYTELTLGILAKPKYVGMLCQF